MPVVRCPNHMSASDPINQQLVEAGQIENVIWTTDLNGKYEKNMSSGRVSIVTDYGIPHIGSNFVTQIYKFSCMGSCTGGTNRRSTAIIFTLEYEGQVIGRQALNCRICSCPKRDKKAQEKNFMKNSWLYLYFIKNSRIYVISRLCLRLRLLRPKTLRHRLLGSKIL